MLWNHHEPPHQHINQARPAGAGNDRTRQRDRVATLTDIDQNSVFDLVLTTELASRIP